MAINWRNSEYKVNNSFSSHPVFKIRYRIVIAVLMCLIITFQHPCRWTVRRVLKLLMVKSKQAMHQARRNVSADDKTSPKLHQDKREQLTFNWTENEINNINIFFLPALAVTRLIGGYLADKYGGKYVVATSALGGSLVNLLTPTLIRGSKGSVFVVMLTRVFGGLFEGLCVPACASVSAHWTPLGERARLYALASSGLMLGSVIHNIWTNDLIVKTKDWATPFYVWGGLLLTVGVLWCVFGASNPENSRYISGWERLYLQEELNGLVHHQRKNVPIWRILKSVDVWGFTVGMVGHVLVWNISVRMLHRYPRDVIGKHLEYMYIQFLPALLMLVMSLIIAWFSDWVLDKHLINLNTLRVTFTNIGIMACPIYMVAATFAGRDVTPVLTLLTIAMGLQGAAISGVRLVALDLSPNYAGFLTGFSTSIGVLGGVHVVYVVIQNASITKIYEYRTLFSRILVGCLATTLVFVIFGRTYLKEWNTPETKPKVRRD